MRATCWNWESNISRTSVRNPIGVIRRVDLQQGGLSVEVRVVL